jgi:hypothetical protein
MGLYRQICDKMFVMTKRFKSKAERKQAEENILRDMHEILAKINQEKIDSRPAEKSKILTILTKFMDLKRLEKLK